VGFFFSFLFFIINVIKVLVVGGGEILHTQAHKVPIEALFLLAHWRALLESAPLTKRLQESGKLKDY
jgi:hypothetical protein